MVSIEQVFGEGSNGVEFVLVGYVMIDAPIIQLVLN